MNRDKLNDEWVEAKRLCRLSNHEVRIARELGIGPRALIRNVPNPKQRWKAPVGVWIRNLYAKREKKPVPAQFNASRLVADPSEHPSEPELEDGCSDFDPPTRQEITDENELILRRQRELRLAAEYVAAAFAQFEPVQKIVLFGSAALRLEKEIPRFRKFRRAAQPIFHECKDVDLAVWLTDSTILKPLQRARSQALNDLFAEHEIGVAHHQVDVFLMAPGTDAYLGRLCNFGECPKGKTACLVQDCGAVKFLRQIEGFTLRPDALGCAKAITLFERGKSTPGILLGDLWEIPYASRRMGSWRRSGVAFPPPPEPVNWDYPCPKHRRISGRGALPVRTARHNPWSIATLRMLIALILLRRLKGCPAAGRHF